MKKFNSLSWVSTGLQLMMVSGVLALGISGARAQVVPLPYNNYLTPMFPGNNLTVLGGTYYSGFTMLGQNGVTVAGSSNGLSIADANYADYVPGENSRNTENSNTTNKTSVPDAPPAPVSLSQAVTMLRGRDYSLTFGWRGDKKMVRTLQITLLDRYHLPLTQQYAEAGEPVVFAPNAKTYAGRYYRVSVVYSDGAIAMRMGTIQ